MNPACEIEEYASSRFTSRCASAARLPHASEMHARTATAIVQISLSSGNAVTRTRYETTSAAVFVAADMNAVTEVGEPWYTSGVHMWNGAAEILKASPARIIASPARRNASSPASAAAICANPISFVAPKTRAEPKSSTAEPNPPTIRYLSPASSEVARSVSIATRM